MQLKKKKQTIIARNVGDGVENFKRGVKFVERIVRGKKVIDNPRLIKGRLMMIPLRRDIHIMIANGFQILFGQSGASTATRCRVQSAGTAATRRQTVGPVLETAHAPAGKNRHLHRGRRLDVWRDAAREMPHRAGRVFVPVQARVQPTKAPGPVSQWVIYLFV